ncbi:MAG: carboxypeptidase-like regulatory domain-containing protein, partial [Pirellula sp.]
MNRGRAIASASSGAIAILCWVVFGSIANSQLATGSIVDEDGKAISNVELTPSLFEPNLSIADRKKVATTNASGHWEWDISENASVYCLRAFKPGYAPHEIPIVAGPQVTKLTAASSVQGYVVDSNDREVEGAHVSLVENGPGFSAQPALRTVSDNRGWFELFGVHDNNINLRAWNPSGEAGYLNNVSTAGTKPIVIELLKPKPLEFQVVDEKANPIAGATITLRSWNKTGVFQWSSKSDNRGIATWNDAPVGVLAFDVEREGYSRVWKHIQNWESQRQRIAMRLAGAERCNVVDHDTGAPIDRFVVLYSGEKASALSVPAQELVGWHSVSSLPMDAVIVKNGVLPLDSIPFFDAMDVEVIAIGYSRFKFRLDKHMDLATTPEFRLKQPNVISNAKCKLVDWNGNAVRGAIVMYIAQGGITVSRQSDPIATQLQWPYHVYQHTTDQLGEFRLNARPEFEFVSAWNETGSYTGLSRRLAPDATIQLEPYARLAVRTSIKNYGPFCKLSVQHSIHLDPDKSYAKAHFFTPLEFD